MTRTSEFLLSLALLGWSTSGMTATYRVGTGLGCTHDNLQAALDAAASNASGSFHSILVQAGELPVANLAITNPVADLAIMGGYSSCLGMRSGETVLRRNPAVSNARILSITNAPTDSNMRRTIHLDNLTVTGGHVPELTGGGGLRVVGKVSVQFGERIRIVDNDARVGGGIMVVGGDAGNANKPRLFFDAAYTATTRPVITNNRAASTAAASSSLARPTSTSPPSRSPATWPDGMAAASPPWATGTRKSASWTTRPCSPGSPTTWPGTAAFRPHPGVAAASTSRQPG